jgi:hypothetical protein
LHPYTIPEGCGTSIGFDYKDLCRTTENGYKAIAVFVDHFSGYVMFELTKDVSASSLAQAFIKRVLPIFSIPTRIYSDKGAALTSKLWKYICSMLQIKHLTAAALNPRSAGHTERAVKSLCEALAVLAPNDVEIEKYLPLAEMNVNCTTSSGTGFPPYQLVRGQLPNLEFNAQPIASPIASVDERVYYEQLARTIKELHNGARDNLVVTRQQQQDQYKRSFKTVDPDFEIGDYVMLSDLKIKPHSTQVLTHRKFKGPYLISAIAERPPNPDDPLDTGIGKAYRLVHVKTGERLKNLVPSHRLKRCNKNAASFYQNHPRLPNLNSTTQDNTALTAEHSTTPSDAANTARDSQATDIRQTPDVNQSQPDIGSQFEPAIRIIAQRKDRNGPIKYLVLYADKTRHWSIEVSDDLLKQFRITQEKRRQRKRRAYRRK